MVTLYSAASASAMITREMPCGARPYWAVVTPETSRPSPPIRAGTLPRWHSATSTMTRLGESCLKVVKLGARSPEISTMVLLPRVDTLTPLIRLDAAWAGELSHKPTRTVIENTVARLQAVMTGPPG